ncbi:PilZ domain-containing protein [Henriciella pelagia]|uniref:PilZ domain-containing protein n=1 Tax=Henriciella pelagia TaxID=1977912 RepID=UPI0035140EA0
MEIETLHRYFGRHLTAALLCLGIVPSALADDTCSSLDDYLKLLIQVREVQAAGGTIIPKEDVAALQERLQAWSATPVASGVENPESIQEELDTIRDYADSLQQTVNLYVLGREGIASDELKAQIPADVGDHLGKVQKMNGCVVANPPPVAKMRDQAGQFAGSAGSTPSTEEANDRAAMPGHGSQQLHTASAAQQRSTMDTVSQLNNPSNWLIMAAFIVGGIVSFAIAQTHTRRQVERSQRYHCNRFVIVRIGNRTVRAAITDITLQGMKLKHDGAITRKRVVAVEVDGMYLKATVRWLNEIFAGLKLTSDLSQSQLEQIISSNNAEVE